MLHLLLAQCETALVLCLCMVLCEQTEAVKSSVKTVKSNISVLFVVCNMAQLI